MKSYPSFLLLSALECTNCAGKGGALLQQILICEMLSSLWFCIYKTMAAPLSHWTLWEASVFCVSLRGWCVSVLSKSCHLCEDKTQFKSSISSTQRIVQNTKILLTGPSYMCNCLQSKWWCTVATSSVKWCWTESGRRKQIFSHVITDTLPWPESTISSG